MLFRAPSLDETERGVVRQIEDLKEKLRWRLHEPRRWVGSLRRLSFARNIQLSARAALGDAVDRGPCTRLYQAYLAPSGTGLSADADG
jgi:hypothetical protein